MRFEGGRGRAVRVTQRDILVTDLDRSRASLACCPVSLSTLPQTVFCSVGQARGPRDILGFVQFPMAAAVVDPLQTLSAALAAPPDSNEQADLLTTLRESLEARPQPIPILCTTLIKNVSGANDSLLKRWVLDLLHFAICRSPLSMEVRTNRQCLPIPSVSILLAE